MANKKFDKVRDLHMDKVRSLLKEDGYDVLRTGSNEICIPVVGDGDEEGYLVITFKIPTGSRDGEAYDGYEMAEDYKIHCEEQQAKLAEKAAAKAKKIAQDQKSREEKARLRAERKSKGE